MDNNCELAVIGSLLLSDDKEAINFAFAKLTAKFFTIAELSALFDNFKEQFLSTGLIDLTLACQLGEEYTAIIKSCMDFAGTPTLLKNYCEILFNKHRKAVLTAQIVTLYENTVLGAELDATLAEIAKIQRNQDAFAEIESTSKSLDMLNAIVEYLQSFSRPESNTMLTGLHKFDYITGGFVRKTYNVLAGRSGMGKSDFAIFLACAIAAKKAKVLYLTMEMPTTQIISRITSRLTNIDASRLRDKRDLTADNFATIATCLDRVANLPIHFDEQQGVSIDDIKLKIKQHKPDVLIIDHIGLMAIDKSKKNKWESVQENSVELKRIAMKENISILALVQQGGDVEKRKEKEGRLSDLKGSDSIGNDADMVMFIRCQKDKDTFLKGSMWLDSILQIEKSREGSTGNINYHWQPQFHRYTEVEDR